MKYKFKVHKESDGYWAESINIQGCYSQGATKEELAINLRMAVELHGDRVGPCLSITQVDAFGNEYEERTEGVVRGSAVLKDGMEWWYDRLCYPEMPDGEKVSFIPAPLFNRNKNIALHIKKL